MHLAVTRVSSLQATATFFRASCWMMVKKCGLINGWSWWSIMVVNNAWPWLINDGWSTTNQRLQNHDSEIISSGVWTTVTHTRVVNKWDPARPCRWSCRHIAGNKKSLAACPVSGWLPLLWDGSIGCQSYHDCKPSLIVIWNAEEWWLVTSLIIFGQHCSEFTVASVIFL